ncbi:MAG: HIT domain-containing protein [Patescibacteria group bacterium]
MDCVFCKIAEKELSSEIVYEDENILGFVNINPEAPLDFLFIPKKHLIWEQDFSKEDLLLLSYLLETAKLVAKEKGIFSSCKMLFNIGKTGEIPHIHLHLWGGWDSVK